MAQTVIATNSPLARKLYSVAAFAAAQRAPSFTKNLIGEAPQQSDAEKRLRGQTSPDMPIVRVTDLSKGGGDKISVDMYNIIGGKPVMGDEKLNGKAAKPKVATPKATAPRKPAPKAAKPAAPKATPKAAE